jgi:hypothetical protein
MLIDMGSSNLHSVDEDSRESPKFSVFGALFRKKFSGIYFLSDELRLVTYLDIL